MHTLREKDHVEDKWFLWWGIGFVRRVTKTRVVVNFAHAGITVYDNSHASKFLRKI